MSSQLLVSRSLTGSRAVKLRKARVHRGTTHYALRKVRFLSLGIGYAAVRSFVLRTGPPLHTYARRAPRGGIPKVPTLAISLSPLMNPK